MVFDWFRRRKVQKPAANPNPPKPEEAAPTPDQLPAEPSAAEQPISSPEQASSPEPEPEPEPAGTPTEQVQEDPSLAWAKAAYARLKAEQEVAKTALQETLAPEPATAAATAEAPSSPAPASSPDQIDPQEEGPSSVPGEASLGLLAKARAEREQREAAVNGQAIDQAIDINDVESPPQPGAEDTPEPSLGGFDEEFTWSAEVLAAQGRQVEDVSLEEIHWLGRLRRGMEKTRRGLVTRLLESLGSDPLTPEIVDDLEAVLLQADVGLEATDAVLEALRRRINEEVVPPSEGLRLLKDQLRQQLEEPIRATGCDLLVPQRQRLNVWLLVGVNGVGKTTTLGKLANLAVRSGYSCMVAAADTFRAAAVQQVSIWAERSHVDVIANPSANADPAAVVFDAIGAAQSKDTELLLVDTAGRLQTKHNLMEELAKIRTIIDRKAPNATIESLLVLDASQGQNGLRQALAFAQAAQLTGVVLTKLDGSAKGGVALAVASEARLPIRFIGAGEGIRDLRPFNSFEFVEALLAQAG